MRPVMSSLRLVFCSLAVAGICFSGTTRAAVPEYVQEILRNAKAEARTVPGQVEALVGLAWPNKEDPDPAVQAEARRALVLYGHHVLPVLRRTIPDLDPLYQGDAVAAFIEARLSNPAGMPPDYLPGLEEAIWYGSSEAVRIALNEIKRYNYPPAVLSSLDACYDNPILTRYVALSLGIMGDPRARLFLGDLANHGSDFYKAAAARALQSYGESTVTNLRSAARGDDASLRESALRVLLQMGGTADLDLFREYLKERTEDDPELREAVQKRVDVLEQRLAS